VRDTGAFLLRLKMIKIKKCLDCNNLIQNKSIRCPKCSRAAQLPPVLERFWSKVKVGNPNECWEWQAGYFRKIINGKEYFYGSFTLNGKTLHAHRFIFELLNGPLPSDIEVCHTCDNPPCCNPSHLFSGTHTDNMQDMADKGRTGTKQGLENWNTKLTIEQVNEIRNRYIPRKVSQRLLAKEYGISQAAIFYILKGKNWGHTLERSS
jgi:HNH endonuclease